MTLDQIVAELTLIGIIVAVVTFMQDMRRNQKEQTDLLWNLHEQLVYIRKILREGYHAAAGPGDLHRSDDDRPQPGGTA